MATGAAARLDHAYGRWTLRTINEFNDRDRPRKKRRRGQETREPVLLQEEGLFWRSEKPVVPGVDSFVVRLLTHWIRDPLCRRVAASELRLPRPSFQKLLSSSSPSSATPPPNPLSPRALRSLPTLEKRFPRFEDEDFVNFETLKSFVADASPSAKESKVVLHDGDSVEIGSKSLGHAFELRKKERESAVENRLDRRGSPDGSEAASSFDILDESFDYNLRDEGVYPPPGPTLGPIRLKIPAPVSREEEVKVSRRDSSEDDFICISRREESEINDESTSCEWRSDATSQVELSFRTQSLLDDPASTRGDAVDDDATKWMVERFKRRLEKRMGRTSSPAMSMGELPASEKKPDRNPFCAVPLELFGGGDDGGGGGGGRRKNPARSLSLQESISKLAFVDEVMATKRGNQTLTDLFGGQKASGWKPFLCEGKIVRLALDEESSASSADFLVTPRFDLTLEEYLQQMCDSSIEGRLLLFLQSLEAVAGLHSRGLSHGSLAASNFFLDLRENGKHRLLLSDFSKAEALTEEGQKSDSWHLGRLGLRLFDNDVDGVEMDADDRSVNELPVLDGEAPLEMDILVHLLMRKRVTPSIAANMLHLYFWRNELRSTISKASLAPSTASSPSTSSSSAAAASSSGFSSQNYEAAKTSALRNFSARRWSEAGSAKAQIAGEGEGDDVKLDLKRCLFQRANFDDVLHADEMWKKSRMDMAKYAVTKDEGHLSLFVDAGP